LRSAYQLASFLGIPDLAIIAWLFHNCPEIPSMKFGTGWATCYLILMVTGGV
jgi:hypothetical protein